MEVDRKKFLRALDGEILAVPPMWLMRQAGRYLPEYRQTRAIAGSFLDLCFNPKLATEVTLQPIRRFGFDAAILFSDILVVPHALGQAVSFEEGHGPRLSPRLDEDLIHKLDHIDLRRLDPVFEAIELIKTALPAETALIGFCGAPWTVASYMIAGQGSRDLEAVRIFAYAHREAFARLIDILVESSVSYLLAQAKAGVEAVQIFDSWCSVLPTREFEAWCVAPVARMVEKIRNAAPDLKIIGFPREAGGNLELFASQAKVDCVSLGTAENVALARKRLPPAMALQGNLDPLALIAGGKALDASVDKVLADFEGAPFVFNLGHGILPQTPIEHVERLVARVRRT
ncbi:MAG: uroporphyrinogen decarboxylase [Hyphomicrobiales bacterium]|nr:uroporphyrinogen decarboxylase [Hyphomicrobiales bacterium]